MLDFLYKQRAISDQEYDHQVNDNAAFIVLLPSKFELVQSLFGVMSLCLFVD